MQSKGKLGVGGRGREMGEEVKAGGKRGGKLETLVTRNVH